MKFLVALVIVVFGGTAMASTLDCSQPDHQITLAKCILKQTIEGKSPDSVWSKMIEKQVRELKSEGLSISEEYSASFLGGQCSSSGSCEWTYLVSVDFYTLNKFESVAAVIKTYPTGSALFKKVFDRDEIKNFIK